ncbi:diphosphomevalonate decarboxylase [Aplysia californica]|uniref:Diphosphomevalonate decarboxylase n=1 Tax=Aplysia californica TaxID=6500 RepID=A0ABM0JZX1_APLCA|nr:diphosphomevalonate decarboxylase [Aplysia californica]
MSVKMDETFRCVTCTAPVNIAVIKYWGKRNEKLILPTNPSLSVTLGQDELRAKTSVAFSSKYTEDRMWLNGKEESVSSQRIQNVLKEVRRRVRKRGAPGGGNEVDTSRHIHIVSENNFPTAAGLASSAAGYACLVYSLCKLYGVQGEISDIARQGSGSACRSIYGGYVLWKTGDLMDGTDSFAEQVAPESHWPEMRSLICVVSDQKKHVGSTEGMQTTVLTSELMQHRVDGVVSQRTDDMIEAIMARDFPTFAKITMQESNQLHAVCLDTYPPIFYMTDTSRLIVRLVHAINDVLGDIKVAYTFDAGPNACLYLLKEDVPRVMGLLRHFFPPAQRNGEPFVTGLPVDELPVTESDLAGISLPQSEGAIKYVIHTKVGPGPQVVTDPSESLIDADGSPKQKSS